MFSPLALDHHSLGWLHIIDSTKQMAMSERLERSTIGGNGDRGQLELGGLAASPQAFVGTARRSSSWPNSCLDSTGDFVSNPPGRDGAARPRSISTSSGASLL